MASVTKRISEIKQPRGGYVKPALFEKIIFNDNIIINSDESVQGSVIGTVVDYLTRFQLGSETKKAFKMPLMGALVAEEKGNIKGSVKNAFTFFEGIKGLDDDSIINACKLVKYDVWARNPLGALMAEMKGTNIIEPDSATIENIRTFVNRSVALINNYGPLVADGFTFEPDGYTETVNSGDGDFLTNDTIWDLKVLQKPSIDNKHTLQLMMYWIMGKHSKNKIFDNVTKVGVFNPRHNTAYILDISKVPQETIESIENEVICY